MKHKKIFIFFLIFLSIILITSTCYAADPKLVSTIKKAFESIQSWIIKIATPAAAVAVGTGIL